MTIWSTEIVGCSWIKFFFLHALNIDICDDLKPVSESFFASYSTLFQTKHTSRYYGSCPTSHKIQVLPLGPE